MNGGASHDSIRELLAAVAMGAASAEEAALVRAHVGGCAECRQELDALRESAGLVGLAGPARQVPDLSAVRARLMQRVTADQTKVPASPGAGSGALRWWAIAATVALAVTASWLATSLRDRLALRRSLAEQASASATLARQLRDSLAASNAALAAITGPGVTVVSLTSSAARQPRGWMFWDQQASRWTLLARDLPELRPGRTYQLWVITSAGTKVSAGTFEPANGQALVQATYPLPRSQLAAIAVTEEPEGGVPQPTGAIVIAGSPG